MHALIQFGKHLLPCKIVEVLEDENKVQVQHYENKGRLDKEGPVLYALHSTVGGEHPLWDFKAEEVVSTITEPTEVRRGRRLYFNFVDLQKSPKKY